jgi:TolB protein
MRLSESSPRPHRRRFARSHWLSSSLGLLLFGTGCPQLLDDDFARQDSDLTRLPPNAGSGGEGIGGSGGSNGPAGGGAGGPASGGGSGNGGSGNGGSGNGGSGGAGALAGLRSCPFGEPEPLVGLDFGTGSEWGASLSADALTLFFAHETPGEGADLYRATRPDRSATFSTPVALTDLNTSDDDGTPFVSADGLRLYFFSNRGGGPGARDLYVARRSDVTEEFTGAELLANVNTSANDHLPRLSSDELTLRFTSSRAGGAGAADLWTASRASIDASFGAAAPFDAVNGATGDESGCVTQDGLVLVFDSTRDGPGNSEIFITTRTSVDEAFPSPAHLTAVNSAANEYNVFLTLDERELFFSSNRAAGSTHHLFRSLRSCD